METIMPLLPKLVIPFMVTIPFVELGLTVPYALLIADATPMQTVLLAFPGHALLVILWGNFIYTHGLSFADKHAFTKNMVERAKGIHVQRTRGLPELAILAMMSLPLPIGGAWITLTAAAMFGVERRRAIALALVGSFLGSIQFTLLWSGVFAATAKLFSF